MVPCILDTHAIGEPLTRVVTITAIVDLRLAIIPSGIREDNKVKYARRVGSERDIAAKLNLKLETSQRNTTDGEDISKGTSWASQGKMAVSPCSCSCHAIRCTIHSHWRWRRLAPVQCSRRGLRLSD
jgi:hypothetical protein